MSRALEVFLKDNFNDVTRFFIEAFPRAYRAFAASDADYQANFAAYIKVLRDDVRLIYASAASEIGIYLNRYRINVTETADEFKLIYYLSRAIEKRLRERGLSQLAQIQQYTMIGLLDFRLEKRGFEKKPQLTKALTMLVKAQEFDAEMGATGCYLIYKCVSTAKTRKLPGAESL